MSQILPLLKISDRTHQLLLTTPRGKQGTYWYYKLHSSTPTFPTKSGKLSKYKHLGKAGSDAHIEALMQVTRRTQIEILKRTIAALTQTWVELYEAKQIQEQRRQKKKK